MTVLLVHVGDLSVGAGSSRVDVGKLQDNIDSMRTHLGRQVFIIYPSKIMFIKLTLLTILMNL